MTANYVLLSSKTKKDDEYYTPLDVAERGLEKWSSKLEGKRVYCNCDDPSFSAFFRYFNDNYEKLKLKALYTTFFARNSYIFEREGSLPPVKRFFKKTGLFEGFETGSYDDEECLEILQKCDIVVTNPPFSLAIPFLKKIIEYKKDFILILGVKFTNYIIFEELFLQKKIHLINTHFGKSIGFLRKNGELKKISCFWFSSFREEKKEFKEKITKDGEYSYNFLRYFCWNLHNFHGFVRKNNEGEIFFFPKILITLKKKGEEGNCPQGEKK